MDKSCPSFAEIALYLEKRLSEEGLRSIEGHLVLCPSCRELVCANQRASTASEEKPLRMPPELRANILKAVCHSQGNHTVQLIYRAGTNVLEQILGPSQLTQLQPFAVRGGQDSSNYRVKLGAIDVIVSTEQRDDGSFDIWLKAKPEKKEFFRCEWQLWKGNKILEQIPSDNGEGLFSSMAGGTYQLILTLSGEEVGGIDITLSGSDKQE